MGNDRIPLSDPLRQVAPAKVNLYLHVAGQRADGYHLLDSLAVFPGAADILYVAPAETLSLTLTGPFGLALQAEQDNLVLRAARALAQHGATTGAHITLEKHLPIASGIGGGSADAAAALRVLAQFWDCPVDATTLGALARALGADVPVCLHSAPTRMRGVGDVLEPAPLLPDFAMVLVNPMVAVPTAAVFAARTGRFSALAELPPAWGDVATMAADLAQLSNDLEPPALRLFPVIAEVLEALRAQPGCFLARMSGSGATCFGLFADAAAAAAAVRRLTTPMGKHPWWCWSGAHGRTSSNPYAQPPVTSGFYGVS